MPTNFRSTPKNYTTRYGTEPIEIKFFGIQGNLL